MRKALAITLLLLLSFVPLYSWSTTIETSQGEQELTLPDGYTFEEAYIEMATLYLEEKYDHDELIDQTEILIASIENYKKRIDTLQGLTKKEIDQRKELETIYEQAIRPDFLSPAIEVGIEQGFDGTISGSVAVGGELFETVTMKVDIGFPLSIGLRVGLTL